MVSDSTSQELRAAAAAGISHTSTSQTIESSARTVEEAVDRALRQLGCTRDEVEVEVLHPGSPGRLLGFGAEPARVRVTRLARAAASAEAAVAEKGAVAGWPAAAEEEAAEPVEDLAEEEEAEEYAEEPGEGRPAAPRGGEAELARIMLVELLNRMGMPGLRVDIQQAAEPIMLNIVGVDVADLIGRRGEHLRALQFVLSLMLNKQLRRHVRVQVDVDGYRARREVLLRNMARRFAQRVRVTHEPLQLEAMPPHERRIVHLALADDPDVTTESTGEGEARRVVIKPRR